MNVWLITTGSSDVQVKDVDVWDDWYPEIKRDLCGIDRKRFKPTRTIDDEGVPYRMAARVLGLAYEKLGEVVREQLEFPLLEEFQRQLKTQVTIDQIILLVSDQSEVFDQGDRESYHCPYWQDTCLLYPVLEANLQTQFPTAQITPLLLKPAAEQSGLDSWNEVLTLVQRQIGVLTIEPEIVYVSHQAGTPAISSAVQFSSLARFGDRVKFLVSNEYRLEQADLIESSTYLRGIRKQEAVALLKNFDYSAIQQLLDFDLQGATNPVTQSIVSLLDMAVTWNSSKFKEFLEARSKLPLEKLDDWWNSNWWRLVYEAAYLATIRLEQGNTVEAFFHSFRAIEGAFSSWGKQVFHQHIQIHSDRAFLQPSILEDSKDYFKGAKFKSDNKTPKNSLAKLKLKFVELKERLESSGEMERKPKGILMYGDDLYILFRSQNQDYEQSQLNRFWNTEDGISEKRNKNFHQLQGLSEAELLQDWEVDNLQDWEKRILMYLNFITKEYLPEEFKSLKNASWMPNVHQELEKAIGQLHL